MKDQTLRVDYYVITSDDKPGVGADLHQKLAKEGVNLYAVLAFPSGGKVQVDVIPENPESFTKAARKPAFLVQGTDRAGALGELLERLGSQGINVRATCGVACGGNRYGALLWVNPAQVEAAGRALGAQLAAHHV